MTSISLSLLIQISSLRRNNNVFTSVINNHLILMSRYTKKGILSWLGASAMTRLTRHPNGCTHRTRKPFCISKSPEKPRIARELRLRVTPTNDPASFKSGSDLLLTNGQPWTRPLYALSKYYPPLYDKLRQDRLVSDDLDTVLSTLPSKRWARYRTSQLLYTFDETFIIDFSRAEWGFFIITEQGIQCM